jgi:NAD(P)-dependent dehydrogenase (short-subunit alcohol dehydrogenase family)
VKTHAGVAGRVVLVTGPARGIGEATARLLAARGARCSLVGLEPERLAALADELPGDHLWHTADVTDSGAMRAAVHATVAELGGIDVVVANAGIACNGTVAVTPIEALVRVIDVNLSGVVRTVHAALPHVTERRGYLLLVSSAAALAALPGISTYAAAKAGVELFGNALRLEVAHHGVDVGVAHPAWIDTDLVRDPLRELPGFRRTLRSLPGPFGSLTPVEACAVALVDAIERRRRQVFVPRSLGPLAAVRQLLTGRLFDRAARARAAESVPRLEREVAALGRSFGATSVESALSVDGGERNPRDRPPG